MDTKAAKESQDSNLLSSNHESTILRPDESTTMQLKTTGTSKAEGNIPFTSSTAFRVELTSRFACDLYESRLAYIRAKREPTCEGVKHDFKDPDNTIQQLRELASFADAQRVDASSALEFQRDRRTALGRQENELFYKWWRVAAGTAKYIDQFDFMPHITNLCDKTFRLHWERLNQVDEEYVQSLSPAFLDLETRASTEREVRLLRERLDLSASWYILDSQLSRVVEFDTNIRELVASGQSFSVLSWEDYQSRSEEYLQEIPPTLDEYDKHHAEFIREWTKLQQQLNNADHKIVGFTKYRRIFREYSRWCSHDADFAQSLSLFTGPFRLSDLCREVRDAIYGPLLSFNYNVTDTQLAHVRHGLQSVYVRYCHKNHISIVWSHPLFHVSRQIRAEASEQFYKRNSFASRSLSTFCNVTLRPDFSRLTTNLSITWPSLGTFSVQACQALKSFTGLRSLKIYLNWIQLSLRRENTLNGISAFESLLNHFMLDICDMSDMCSIGKIEIFDVSLSRREQSLQGKIIDSLEEGEEDDNGDGEEDDDDLHPRRSPPRWCNIPGRARILEEKYDKVLSARILNAHLPKTRYNGNGRYPQKPTWEALNLKTARKGAKKGRQYVPVVGLVERQVVQMRLEEIRSAIVAKRVTHLEQIAVQQKAAEDRYLERLRAERAVGAANGVDLPGPGHVVQGVYNWDGTPFVFNGVLLDETDNAPASNEPSGSDSGLASNQEMVIYAAPKDADTSDLESFWRSFDSYLDEPAPVEAVSEDEKSEPADTKPHYPTYLSRANLDPDSLEAFWSSFDGLLTEEAE